MSQAKLLSGLKEKKQSKAQPRDKQQPHFALEKPTCKFQLLQAYQICFFNSMSFLAWQSHSECK